MSKIEKSGIIFVMAAVLKAIIILSDNPLFQDPNAPVIIILLFSLGAFLYVTSNKK
jgi:hypothetical protein